MLGYALAGFVRSLSARVFFQALFSSRIFKSRFFFTYVCGMQVLLLVFTLASVVFSYESTFF